MYTDMAFQAQDGKLKSSSNIHFFPLLFLEEDIYEFIDLDISQYSPNIVLNPKTTFNFSSSNDSFFINKYNFSNSIILSSVTDVASHPSYNIQGN